MIPNIIKQPAYSEVIDSFQWPDVNAELKRRPSRSAGGRLRSLPRQRLYDFEAGRLLVDDGEDSTACLIPLTPVRRPVGRQRRTVPVQVQSPDYPGGISRHFPDYRKHPKYPGELILPLKMGTVDDLEIWHRGVFPGIPGRGWGSGLRYYIRTRFGLKRIPTYIMYPHNLMLFGVGEVRQELGIREPFNVWNYDWHHDCSASDIEIPPDFDPSNLEAVADLAVRVGSGQFLDAGRKIGLVGNCTWAMPVRRRYSSGEDNIAFPISIALFGDNKARCRRGSNPLAVSVDMDVVAHHFPDAGDWSRGGVPLHRLLDRDIEIVREGMKQADVIIIDPGFVYIPADRSLPLIRRLLS
jgi:hypothetical protein